MKRNARTNYLLALIFVTSLLVSLITGPLRDVNAFQFVDRILRPCGGTSTGIVIVTTTDINLNPCPGGSVKVNGTPITPGAGLPDPGSNGFVVRTALNTDVARTLTVAPPITITNATGVAGNPLISCPTCVTASAALTSTALMTGAGLTAAQTPAATATLAANGDISTPGSITTGNAGGANGALDLSGLTSGTATITVAAVAGTWTLQLPINDGTPGQFLQTDGGGITSWQTVSGFTCGACTVNTVQKGDGAGNLANSRILDNGTNIDANSGAGAFLAGDTAFAANGVNLNLDDVNNRVVLQSDGNGNVQVLNLDGPTQKATLQAGSTLFNIDGANNNASFQGANLSPTSNAGADLGTSAVTWKQLFIDATITAGGTTGNQTIDKAAGSVNFAAAATSLTVTSNKVTANSVLICTVATNDTTLKSVQCVPGAGSFVIFGNAAATAETRINFWILNQ